MIFRSILPCLALTLVPTSVGAREFALDRVQQAASLADLEGIIASLGHKVEARDAANQSLRAVDSDGTRYVLTGTACDLEGIPGCRGIAMQVLFEGEVTYERLAEANLNQVAVSTRYDPRTRVISVTRYVVLDGGARMANLAENLRVLLAVAPEVMAILMEPAESVAGPE